MNEKMSLQPRRIDRRAFGAFLVVMTLSAFLCFFRLGDRSFRNPDEGRYALASREMLQSGDWVRPTLYGVKYLKKPVLFYWMVATSFKLFGTNELAARLAPAIFCWLGVGIIFLFAHRFYGLQTAIFSGLILATNVWYLQVGRYLVIDSTFSFFITSAMFSFFLAISSENKRSWYLFFYALTALAFLTKGLIALALPALAIGAYLILTRTFFKTMKEARILAGLFIFLIVAGPWYFLMQKRDPGFMSFFFLHEHWNRFMSSNFEHQEPWFYYAAVLPLILFPWSLFWKPLQCVLRPSGGRSPQDPRLYLLVWTGVMLIFFSLSRAKLPTYILPCLAPVILLISRGWDEWAESKMKLGVLEYCGAGLLILSAIGILAGGSWYVAGQPHKFPDGIGKLIQILGGTLLAAAVIALRSIQRQRAKQIFYSLVIAMGLSAMPLIWTMETVNAQYSTKTFAQFLKPLLQTNDSVYIYDHPGPFYDFAFYLERPVKLVGLEGELEFSRDDPRAEDVSVPKKDFLKQLEKGNVLYCLIRKSDYFEFDPALRETLKILKQDGRKILFRSGIPGKGLA